MWKQSIFSDGWTSLWLWSQVISDFLFLHQHFYERQYMLIYVYNLSYFFYIAFW